MRVSLPVIAVTTTGWLGGHEPSVSSSDSSRGTRRVDDSAITGDGQGDCESVEEVPGTEAVMERPARVGTSRIRVGTSRSPSVQMSTRRPSSFGSYRQPPVAVGSGPDDASIGEMVGSTIVVLDWAPLRGHDVG